MGTLASPWWDTKPEILCSFFCRGGLGVDDGWGACAALVDVPAPCWVLTSRRPGGCTRALLGTYVAPPWWMYPRPVGYLRRAALVDITAACGYLRHPACPNSTLLHDPPAQGDGVPTAPSTAPAPTRTIPFPTPSHEKLTRENGLGVDDGWRRLRRPWCELYSPAWKRPSYIVGACPCPPSERGSGSPSQPPHQIQTISSSTPLPSLPKTCFL